MTASLLTINALYLIDSRLSLADRDRLIAGLPVDSAWALLDDEQDGLSQIRDIVAGYSGLGSLHLIGHGAPGSLLLGSSEINLAVINQHAAELAQIGHSLSPNGDILLYGCNVAHGEVGQAYIEQLARLTQADVAASTDRTGAQGDWDLEATTGAIEANHLNVAGFEGTLDAVGVSTLTTANRKPTLTGTINRSSGRVLEVEVGGRLYKEGGGKLSVSGDTWTLNLSTETGDLAVGSLDIKARIVNAKPSAPALISAAGTVTASTGNIVNLLSGSVNNDTIIGREDTRADIVLYNGSRSDYSIKAGVGVLEVINKLTGEVDTLTNLNQIKFSDSQAPEFVLAAAARQALTGINKATLANASLVSGINVSASKLYNGTKAAETFVVADNVSAMILAGQGDTVDLSGRIADYVFTAKGTQLQISDGTYTTTINIGGGVTLRTASGSYAVSCTFVSSVPSISVGGIVVDSGFSVATKTKLSSTLSSNAQTVVEDVTSSELVVQPFVYDSQGLNVSTAIPATQITPQALNVGSGQPYVTELQTTDYATYTRTWNGLTLRFGASLLLKNTTNNEYKLLNHSVDSVWSSSLQKVVIVENLTRSAMYADPASLIPLGFSADKSKFIFTTNYVGYMGRFVQPNNFDTNSSFLGVIAYDMATGMQTLLSHDATPDKVSMRGPAIGSVLTPDANWVVFNSGVASYFGNSGKSFTDVFNKTVTTTPAGGATTTVTSVVTTPPAIPALIWPLSPTPQNPYVDNTITNNISGTTWSSFVRDGEIGGATTNTSTTTVTSGNDLFATNVYTGEIRLLSGVNGVSIGSSATLRGFSEDGNFVYYEVTDPTKLIGKDGQNIADSNGNNSNLVAVRLNLLDLAYESDTEDFINSWSRNDNITTARSIKITASISFNDSMVLRDNGAIISAANVSKTTTADGVTWVVSNLSIGQHQFTVFDTVNNCQILLDGSTAASALNVKVVADTVGPTVGTISLAETTGGREGDIVKVAVTFSEQVVVSSGTPIIKLRIGAQDVDAVYVSGSGTDTLKFTYTIPAGMIDTDGIGFSANGISGGTIKDLSGNDAVLSYSAIADNPLFKVENQPPTYETSSPANATTNFAIDSNLTLKFSEPVKASTGSFILASGTERIVIAASDVNQVSFSGNSVTINPKIDLRINTNYILTYDAGVVTDFAGNPVAAMNDAESVRFSTSGTDVKAPTLLISPALKNATNVHVESDIVLEFSEPIQAGAGYIRISDGQDIRDISITDSSQVTISGNMLRINPTADLWLSNTSGDHLVTQSLLNGTVYNPRLTVTPRNYSVTMNSGVIKDLKGNDFTGLTNANGGSFSFTTESTNINSLQNTGASSNRVDLVLVGEGFTASELQSKFSGNALELFNYMFNGITLYNPLAASDLNGSSRSLPYDRYQSFINFHALDVASAQSGADSVETPNVDTVLEGNYGSNINISTRLGETLLNQALAGTGISADIKVALLNIEKEGGITQDDSYILPGTTWLTSFKWASYTQRDPNDYAGGLQDADVAVHEIGHQLFDLGDEYWYGFQTRYTYAEPTAPNLTTDPTGAKWDYWIGKYQPGLGIMGVYEGGAGGYGYGIYRPSFTSKMRNNYGPFNLVSREAMVREFYRIVDPLDHYTDGDISTSSLAVKPIDPSVINLEWVVDGVVATTRTSIFDLTMLDAGTHQVSVRAWDSTDWVRPDYQSELSQTQTWTINKVTPTILSSGADNFSGTQNGDWILAGDGDDTLMGGLGSDRLEGEGGNDLINGGGGDDFLVGGTGVNLVDGGEGIDTISYKNFSQAVTLSLASIVAQQTTIFSTDSVKNVENIFGGAGNDTLTGNNLANELQGLGGDDVLWGGAGNDILNGGIGNDLLHGGADYDFLYGDIGDDSLFGEESNDRLEGGEGNDTLDGGAGDDSLLGGDGNDILNGDFGEDTLEGGVGNDTINGGADNDVIKGGTGINMINGGSGFNTLSYKDATCGVTVNLAITSAQNTEWSTDTLSNIQILIGSEFNDVLSGNASGWNTLEGGAGDDLLIGGTGDDIFVGGEGNDTVSFERATFPSWYPYGVVATLSADPNVPEIELISGQARGSSKDQGFDTIYQVENLIGSSSGDTLTGDKFNNILNGKGGSDTLTGNEGSDTFVFDSPYRERVLAQPVVTKIPINVTGSSPNHDVVTSKTYISVSDLADFNISILLTDSLFATSGAKYNVTQSVNGTSSTSTESSPYATLSASVSGGTIADLLNALKEDPDYDQLQKYYTLTADSDGINISLHTDIFTGSVSTVGLDAGLTITKQTASTLDRIDRITDFLSGTDKISLSSGIFTGLTSGVLGANQLGQGAAATNDQQRILYDAATGNLLFDADANGSNPAYVFATLVNRPTTISATDFVVV